ncbi:MAG: hypothetical protein WBO49_03090 [Candidatus Saccharimonas sp.]
MSEKRKDYFWNTLGVFLQNAISPLLLIVVTRVNGIYDSGIFSYAFSIAILFWAIAMWGGRTYQVSDVQKEFSHKNYIIARIITGVAVIAITLGFIAINNYDGVKAHLLIALTVMKVLESMADVFYGILQSHRKLYIAGKSLTYKAVLGAAVFVLLDFVTHNLFLASWGIVAVNIVFLVVYDIRLSKKQETISLLRGNTTKQLGKALNILKRCTPIFFVTLLAMLSLNIPRYFLDIHHPDKMGYFGVIAMPITLIVLIVSFILQPKVVELSQLYASNQRVLFAHEIKKILALTMSIGIVLFGVTFLVGVPILNVVFGVDFSNFHTELMVMIVGGILNSLVSVFMNILVIMRQIYSQLIILATTCGGLAIFGGEIVLHQGFMGAVMAFAITCALQACALAVSYRASLGALRS